MPSSWSTSTSSVEPPPMSKISAGPSPGSSSLWQPSTASRASSCGSMMSRTMPVSWRTRSTNSAPLSARRQASVATERDQRDVAAAKLFGADRQRADRPVHRLLRQRARLRQAFAKPDDARESVDDGEAAVDRPGDQQAAIIGAEIDRAIGVRGHGNRRSGGLPDGRLRARDPAAGAGALATVCAMNNARFYPAPPESRSG